MSVARPAAYCLAACLVWGHATVARADDYLAGYSVLQENGTASSAAFPFPNEWTAATITPVDLACGWPGAE